jgi:hypothetical protein
MICNNSTALVAADRPVRLALLTLAATLLAGCQGVGSYEPSAPPAVNFAGTWRLNAAQSDDPRKVLQKLQPKRSSSAPPGISSERRRRGGQPGEGSGRQQVAPLPDDPLEAPLPRSAFALVPNADLLRNEVLGIKQLPDAFVLDYGTSVRRLTPGQHSVVSVPGGVGDQSTGWKGRDYVVEVRSQLGLQMQETYSLSDKNGRQLIVKIHISGSGLPSLNLTRVYDPARSETPRSLPSID